LAGILHNVVNRNVELSESDVDGSEVRSGAVVLAFNGKEFKPPVMQLVRQSQTDEGARILQCHVLSNSLGHARGPR